ncbi:MAG: hypothetical protein AAGG75_17610 [Bacteroidota bacterium]
MEVKSGLGLGPIRFGMRRKEVEAVLGEPDEIERFDGDEFEGSITESWHYDEQEVSLSFDEESGWRLIVISVTSNDHLFEGQELIGMELEEFEDFIDALIFGDMDYEDCSTPEMPNHQLIEVDELSMNFWFDDDALTEIQWSPLFDDEESIIWPVEE